MLDIKFIRENTEKVRDSLRRKKDKFDLDGLLEVDAKRRQCLYEVDQLKNKQNQVTKEIPKIKASGQDVSKIMEEMKILSDKIKEDDNQIRDLDQKLEYLLLRIPNIPNDKVPDGESDSDNVEIRKWGQPRSFDFEPKAHWDIGEKLDILDFEKAAKVTGSRFTFYKGLGARLERAIMNFFLDTHTEKHGYKEVFPPFIVNRASLTGTGNLPKFEEDVFKLENTEYFLIPTAEVPVTNMYRDQILDGKELPIKHAAYSACFRSEAGSAGRDTRGLIRQHQFNKVELVKFVKPENSYDELEKLTLDAEEVLKILNLPYRVVLICLGDLGFSAAMKYDIEVWMPSYGRYVEISSCSNFEAYQARRANIKYKDNPTDKAQFVHTLNGSGVAIGRTTAAILENFQQADGSVVIPEPLRKYMAGAEVIR